MNENKELENALNDIFDEDFINIGENTEPKAEEINTNGTEAEENLVDFFATQGVSDIERSIEENLVKETSIKELKEEIKQPVESDIVVNEQVNEEEINIIDEQPTQKEDTVIEEKTETKVNGKEFVTEKKLNEITEHQEILSNKKIFIYFIVGFILGFGLIFYIINYALSTPRVISCSTSAEDDGYKYSDEYKITYIRNKINMLESSYTYSAITDEYKKQIEYIKKEKLPVVINTNGMPGFTYTYESSDEVFKINGYLDFSLIKFKEVDKINQKLMPISFVKINSKTTYKSLKTDLEKRGFKCIPSK